MSLHKSATRRLSLLAGSSLIAASLTAMTGLALTPSAALAANECGNPGTNGAAADSFTCVTPPTYPTGLDYSATTNGDLTLTLRNRFDTTTTGTGGIRMFGNPGETMTLLREDNPLGSGDPRIVNTTGRAIDIRTQGAGNVVINLTDGDPSSGESTNATTGTAPIRITGSTDAIRAEALGTGSVSVTFAATTPAGTQAAFTAGASGGSGIVARTTTGAINLNTRSAIFTINTTSGAGAIDALSTSGNIVLNTGTTFGRLFGIRAQTGGAGTLSLTVNGGAGPSTAAGVGEAGIDTIAATGATTITIVNGGSAQGRSGAAIRSVSASATAVNIQSNGQIDGRVDFSGVTAGGVIFNNDPNGASSAFGRWWISGASVFSGVADTLTLAGIGDNRMAAGSSIDFGAGADTFNLSGILDATTLNLTFGSGADRFNVTGQVEAQETSIDFGADNDVLSLSGDMTITDASINFGAGTDAFNITSGLFANGTTTLSNLEGLNNTGLLHLGKATANTVDETDTRANDVLRMTSGTFTGSGDSRVAMDVIIEANSLQLGCATISAADCLDLRGASSAGQTILTLTNIGADPAQSAYDPVGITLVDVAGAGTSAAEHFVLDPASSGYTLNALYGGVLERPGLFVYSLKYDAVNQRHVLVGLPRTQTMEYVVLAGAAQSIWHMTSRTVTERQSDLRDGADNSSVWVRSTGEYTKRDLPDSFEVFDETFSIDNGYKLYAGTVMGGMDLLSGEHGQYDYVAGVQAGYVSSSFDLNASDTSGRFSGAAAGVYGSVWSDFFFVDGTVNLNGLTLDYEAPGLGSKTTTFLNSVGASAEAGVRSAFAEGLFVEPLVTLSYVRTTFEEISLFGGEVQIADAKSLRGALGVRLGGTLAGEGASATYFVTGRTWEEFEGESGGVVHNPGLDLPFVDDFSGVFGEAEMGINVYNAANTLSGFLTGGVKFKDGYSATSLSLGVRMAW